MLYTFVVFVFSLGTYGSGGLCSAAAAALLAISEPFGRFRSCVMEVVRTEVRASSVSVPLLKIVRVPLGIPSGTWWPRRSGGRCAAAGTLGGTWGLESGRLGR